MSRRVSAARRRDRLTDCPLWSVDSALVRHGCGSNVLSVAITGAGNDVTSSDAFWGALLGAITLLERGK